jgi:hypothetical protein
MKKSFLLIAVTAAALGACRDDPVGPTLIGLECTQPDGSLQECDLILAEAGGFRVTLLSTECMVSGNAVRITKPAVTDPVLTADGCAESPGVLGEFPGPFAAGTPVSIQIESAKAGGNAGLRAVGQFPEWTVEFEDGGDSDFDDLVLLIAALPAP